MGKNPLTKVSDIIARLKEYDQDELIAVNWWTAGDFEEYADIPEAIGHAQDYLDGLNPDLTEYVDLYYNGKYVSE